MEKISLCIPTYNRPDTLRQLIVSFLKQDYKNKELVISDDTPDDSIKDLIEEFHSNDISYYRNSPGLGFSRNLLKSMERATGDFIVLLGDDDILLSPQALSHYVSVFNDNPSVGFVYSNMVQFNDQMNVDYVISFTPDDKQYKKGDDSMENVWLRSIFIGGIGIRNIKKLLKFYPTKKILHPQVELVGNIINQYDSYLLPSYNIGFRSHDDQIIFRALKNKKIRQEGNHMTVEIYEIFNKLKKTYNLSVTFDDIAKELVSQQTVMIFKEKSNLGKEVMQENYKRFINLSSLAKNSRKLKTAFLMANLLPASSVAFLRKIALSLLRISKRNKFDMYQKQIITMTSLRDKKHK